MLSALEVAYPLLAVGLLALIGLAVACLSLGRRLLRTDAPGPGPGCAGQRDDA